VTSAVDYYETPAAVDFLTFRYCVPKETAYCRFLMQFIRRGSSVLELGGGSGFHGSIFAGLRAVDYTFSDKSAAMLACARARGLKAEYRDALNPGPIEQSVVIALQLSTLCSTDQATRFAQFRALADAMNSGSSLIIATARLGKLHSIDAADLDEIERCGFRLRHRVTWGLIPAGLWKFAALGYFESLFSMLGLGIRRITVLRKV
jgi:hypothetical protein